MPPISLKSWDTQHLFSRSYSLHSSWFSIWLPRGSSQWIIQLEQQKPVRWNPLKSSTWACMTFSSYWLSEHQMDLLGVSSEGQPRTLQKASMGPVSSRQASCEDTPPDTGDLSWVLLVTIHSHGTPSLHVQLKTHTHLSCICSSLSCNCFEGPMLLVSSDHCS